MSLKEPIAPSLPRARARRGLSGTGLAVALVTLALGAGPLQAAQAGPLDKLLGNYESIRLLLVADTVEGLAAPATALRRSFDELREDFTAERAGVAPENLYAAGKLLPELATAVQALETAKTLDEAREAFYALSKPLIRYRYLAIGAWPEVAYCPMAKKSWLQPEGEIGNPYYGPAMPRCGSLIEDRAGS